MGGAGSGAVRKRESRLSDGLTQSEWRSARSFARRTGARVAKAARNQCASSDMRRSHEERRVDSA
eukprot:14868074-Alexandrium_andersonii.AAC.1